MKASERKAKIQKIIEYAAQLAIDADDLKSGVERIQSDLEHLIQDRRRLTKLQRMAEKDSAAIVSRVAEIIAANDPYSKIIDGGVFPPVTPNQKKYAKTNQRSRTKRGQGQQAPHTAQPKLARALRRD